MEVHCRVHQTETERVAALSREKEGSSQLGLDITNEWQTYLAYDAIQCNSLILLVSTEGATPGPPATAVMASICRLGALATPSTLDI